MKRFIYTAAILLATLAPLLVFAQTPDLTVTPAVIDEKGGQRDIFNESITLTNTSSHALNLFPSVDNVNSTSGAQTFSPAGNSDDLSNSLANWIEFSRGVIQLQPGESKTIPFVIRINLNAAAADYHATISFSQGNTRDEAIQKPPVASVTVNFEVQANIKEILQLDKFATGNIFFSGDNVLFNYNLENIGNQALDPKGEIRVYDRKGVEVASVDVNREGKSISPSEISQLASVWTAASGFGRYKAVLNVQYGSTQSASVQDTAFFWIIPWKQLLIMGISTLIALIGLSLYFHRWLEQRHLYKLAHAGMLHPKALAELGEEPMMPVIHHPKPAPLPAPERTPSRLKTLFRRRTKEQVHEVAHTRHEPRSSLKATLRREDRTPTHGHSIDLKKLQAQRVATASVVSRPHAPPVRPHHVEVRGHVISLKKPA